MATNPAIQFVFFDFKQPTAVAWLKFQEFVRAWNETEQPSFESETQGEWFITFEKGVKDAAIIPFQAKMDELNKKFGLVWFVGIKDERRAEDFEQAPFIEILGDEYPEGFLTNESTAFSPLEKCPECGDSDYTFQRIVQPIIIDEKIVKNTRAGTDANSAFSIDLVTLPNGGLLISGRILDILKEQKVKGYQLEKVLSKQTMSPSNKYFSISAEEAILKPCSEHTLVTESGICSTCGKILGGLLTNYTVRREWLKGADIFSRHPYRYAKIYITNQLYTKLKRNNTVGMIPRYGIEECSHINH